MEQFHLDCIVLAKPLSFTVLATNKLPTGVFSQKCPILWVHVSYAPNKVLSLFTEYVAELILRALKVSLPPLDHIPQLSLLHILLIRYNILLIIQIRGL